MRRAPSLCRAGNRAGRRETERETKEGGNWARNRVAKVQCRLNRARERKERGKQRRGGRTHGASERISARRPQRPRSLTHLPVREERHGPAHLCSSARTRRAALHFSAVRAAPHISAARAAPPPLRLRAAAHLLVDSPVRPRLRAPPLFLCGLVQPLQDCNGQVIPSPIFLPSALLVCCYALCLYW